MAISQSYPGVSVFLNAGSGAFPIRAEYRQWYGSQYGLVAADFTGDGNKDIAFGNLGTATVGLLTGTGAGKFVDGPSYPMSPSVSLTAADYDGDGKIDLATAWTRGVLVGRNSLDWCK